MDNPNEKTFCSIYEISFKIVYVDENYEYMAVGYPKNTMGWIMGRSSSVSDVDYKKIMDSLTELGYTEDQFEIVKHD